MSLSDNGDGTATLSGTPDSGEVGRHSVMLEVSDGTTSTQQGFGITVGEHIGAPFFTSTPVMSVTSGMRYTYSITTSDPDGDERTITATTLPEWLRLSDNGDGTATLSGTPGICKNEVVPVRLVVSDEVLMTEQHFFIQVSGDDTYSNVACTHASVTNGYAPNQVYLPLVIMANAQ
jgi:hypothetical protein